MSRIQLRLDVIDLELEKYLDSDNIKQMKAKLKMSPHARRNPFSRSYLLK